MLDSSDQAAGTLRSQWTCIHATDRGIEEPQHEPLQERAVKGGPEAPISSQIVSENELICISGGPRSTEVTALTAANQPRSRWLQNLRLPPSRLCFKLGSSVSGTEIAPVHAGFRETGNLLVHPIVYPLPKGPELCVSPKAAAVRM